MDPVGRKGADPRGPPVELTVGFAIRVGILTRRSLFATARRLLFAVLGAFPILLAAALSSLSALPLLARILATLLTGILTLLVTLAGFLCVSHSHCSFGLHWPANTSSKFMPRAYACGDLAM